MTATPISYILTSMNVTKAARLGAASAVPTVMMLAVLLAAPSAVRSQGTRSSTGERLYAQQCAGCHGADLDGGVGPALRGRALLAQSRAKPPTAADLDVWIRANMPVSAPGSLSRAESLAITEYVMRRNGRYGGATALTAETAARLRLR